MYYVLLDTNIINDMIVDRRNQINEVQGEDEEV
jgi:hypothetical protein